MIFLRVEHAAALEHVVQSNQPTGANQAQALLIVFGVVWFVGVDEGEVEPVGFTRGDQPIEGIRGRSDAKIDFVFYPCVFPITARYRGEVLADIARDDLSVWRQG